MFIVKDQENLKMHKEKSSNGVHHSMGHKDWFSSRPGKGDVAK